MDCARRWIPVVAALAVVLALSLGKAPGAWAANAKFTAVVGGVTCQANAQAAWKGAKAGMELGSGTRVRTDRRGKCEIKFPGGSLLRMPSRADLQLTSVAQNQVKLLSGQVLTNAVKGSGVRIEGASATASVQGTWVLFGEGEMSVWDGTATLETPLGQQQVGDQQRAAVADMLMPLVGADGEEYGEVSVRPAEGQLTIIFSADSPWVLRRTGVNVQTTPPDRFDAAALQYDHRQVSAPTDEHVLTLEGPGPEEGEGLYIVAYAELVGEEPGAEVVAWAGGEPIQPGGMYFQYSPAAVEAEYPWEFPTGAARSWWFGIQPGINTVATPGTDIGVEMRDQRLASYDALRQGIFDASTHGRLRVGVESIGFAPAGGVESSVGPWAAPLVWALSGAAGDDETSGVGRLGKRFFGPRTQLDAYGIAVSGGSLVGGRARMAAVYGPLYMELGGQMSTDFDGDCRGGISEAFAIWRNGPLDLTVGRQHYLEGPVNNSPLGAQFGYLTFDGVRARYQGRGFALDGMWIESYQRGLVKLGEGGGWLGRLSAPVLGGQVGVSVLSEDDADTGLSLDFSLPAVPHYLDVYGEFGEDPWHDQFGTWGIYSPWLFDRAGVDLFIEYARRDGYPDFVSAMAYKDISEDWLGLAGFCHTEGEDSELSVGVAWRFGSLAK